jgi:hypothetical protein
MDVGDVERWVDRGALLLYLSHRLMNIGGYGFY